MKREQVTRSKVLRVLAGVGLEALTGLHGAPAAFAERRPQRKVIKKAAVPSRLAAKSSVPLARAERRPESNPVTELAFMPWLYESRFPYQASADWVRYGEDVQGFVLPGVTLRLEDSLQLGVGLPLSQKGKGDGEVEEEAIVKLTKQF